MPFTGEHYFDQLAKALATGRISRRQVIKGAVVGLLLTFGGLLRPRSSGLAEAAPLLRATRRCSLVEYSQCVANGALYAGEPTRRVAS